MHGITLQEGGINCHRLQEIRLLFYLHTQLVSSEEIAKLTISMRFGPVDQQYEVKVDKHAKT